ncbi:MAG: hypothetical protein ACRD96_10635 [Bryobacteraceae bacterium]
MRTAGFILLAVTAFADHRVGTFGSRHGFGNVVYPGTGHPPAVPRVRVHDGGHAGRLQSVVSGFPGYTGAPSGHHWLNRAVGYYPIAYPVYYGGSYYQNPQPQPVTVVMPPQPAPTVIINQHFSPETARPVVREYTESSDGLRIYPPTRRDPVEAPAAEEKRPYLIAFKDHTIYAAFAYWLEGDTLHYVTTHGTHNQLSLDLVDVELSTRLNRERGVDFRIPARR